MMSVYKLFFFLGGGLCLEPEKK